jgi:hypothetical protein
MDCIATTTSLTSRVDGVVVGAARLSDITTETFMSHSNCPLPLMEQILGEGFAVSLDDRYLV